MTDPHDMARRLDLDERAVLLRLPGTLLPKKLYRAHFSLERARLIEPGHRDPLRFVPTKLGRTVLAALSTLVDEDQGWGIFLSGTGANVWWRADGAGYTSDVAQAGLYSREKALKQHGWGRAGPYHQHDVAVPPARMRELIEDDIEKAHTRLERAELQRASLAENP